MIAESTSPMLPSLDQRASTESETRWFAPFGCVVFRGEEREVYVGGLLIGRFERRDQATRKVLAVLLAEDERIKREALAPAFEMTDSALRYLVRARNKGGIKAVAARRRGGSETKVTPALRRKLEAQFAAGASVSTAHETVAHRLGRATVGSIRKEWVQSRQAEAVSTSADAARVETPIAITDESRTAAEAAATVVSGEPTPSAHVQHAGTWLCLSLLDRHGLYRAFEATRRETGVETDRLRVATEAFAAALCLGEGCAEGVRRVATPTAPLLLRVPRAPTEEMVRDTFHRLAKGGALRAHLGVAGHYLVEAQRRGDDDVTLFYVDNHLRPYTGKHVIRKGWRMQDKMVVAGTSDYWVHDADGRPVFRVDVPGHDSLSAWLRPIAETIRLALGRTERILLAFDRAGAFPGVLAELRDAGVEVVTYERRPYPTLLTTAFTETVELDGETLRYVELRTNLGKGRGRLRRVAVLTEDGRQINLLACGATPAAQLIAAITGRWVQENGFKHGVERWGFNQLDGRRVRAYDPDAEIPNPARRRLERAFRVACVAEGDQRRKLADMPADQPRRAALEAALIETVALRRQLDAERASVPRRAPVRETELAGKLRVHDGAYKGLLDTVRIACVNIEADLAALLAPALPKPAESKKTLATIFAAPGRVRVGKRTIAVTLAPAGNAEEQLAYQAFWNAVTGLDLTLPGDPRRRRLRFRSAS